MEQQSKDWKKEQIFAITSSRKFPLNNHWKISNTVEDKLPMPVKNWQKTAILYNAMIHPIIHYPLKDVIWYQGERNNSFC